MLIHDQPVNKLKPIAKEIIKKINVPMYTTFCTRNTIAMPPKIPPCPSGKIAGKLIIYPASNVADENNNKTNPK